VPLDAGLDHFRIAVKDYTIDNAARILRERGIEMSAAPAGAVRICRSGGPTDRTGGSLTSDWG
jgi:hypothetical protein